MSGLEAELADRVRARRFTGYEPELLASLALLPQWDQALTQALRMPPIPDSELVESTTVLREDGSEERVLWVRESIRPELGAYLRREHPRLLEAAVSGLAAFARDVPALDHWLAAVDSHLRDPSGLRLLSAVNRLVEQDAVPEAARLVATAKALAEVVGGHLAGSARRAGWRLARAGREAEDAHYLRHYQPRADIEAEVQRADTWAIHLLGPGGSGKTTMIRHPGQRTARVDFDHLDPRYPEDRPGEMFLALAIDLLGWVGNRASEAAYGRFLDTVDAVHEAGAGTTRADRRRLLDAMVSAFAAFLSSLPELVPLVLDTCEELAKLYPPGEPAPGIDMTFDLLEGLHERLPALRVVLAGRRWLVPPPEDDAPAGPLLRPRPYLKVIHVGGFSAAEAERYLDDRGLRDGRDAVLGRSRTGDGYNPFDLAAYTDWLLAEPGADLSGPGDPYVRARIIGRIRDPAVARCLGVAAELGTLDRTLVGEVFTELGVPADEVMDELAAQEWARVTAYTSDGRPALVELEPNLCERLRAETGTDPGRFPVHTTRLGLAAARVIDAAAAISEVTAATVLPAVRHLDPADAVALWQRVEDRVVAGNAWGWAEQIAARAAAASSGTVLAAVLSTQAACRIHTGVGGVAALWRHVEQVGSDEQRIRAMLGRVAAGDLDAHDDLYWVTTGRAAPAASVVAAVDGWMASVESWEDLRDAAMTAAVDLAGELRTIADDSAVGSLALSQAAIVHFLVTGRADEATALAVEAKRRAGPAVAADLPPSADAHARAELTRLLIAGNLTPEYLTMRDAVTPEADRLRSLHLLPWLSSPIGPSILDAFARLDRYTPGPVSGWVARQVPPFFVMLAEAFVAAGEYDKATRLLRERLEEALAAGNDPGTVEACQLGLLRVCRRDHDLRHYPAIRELALNGSPRCRAEAWITLSQVTGELPATVAAAGSSYAWWRCTGDRTAAIPDEDGIPHALSEQARLEQRVLLGDLPETRLFPELPFVATRIRWLRGARHLDYAELIAPLFPGWTPILVRLAADDLGPDTKLGRQADTSWMGEERRRTISDARPEPLPSSPAPDPPPRRSGVFRILGWSALSLAVVVVPFILVPIGAAVLAGVFAGLVLVILGVALWRSSLLAPGLTAVLSDDGETRFTRHTYARWGGPAWRDRLGWWTPKPRTAGVSRLTRAARVLVDRDPQSSSAEKAVFGHLPAHRLPAMFRSAHTSSRFALLGDYSYAGPSHLPNRRPNPLGGRRHVVGTALDTIDGVRLRVTDAAGLTSEGPRRERLIEPVGDHRLHILQADPVDGPPRPLDPLERRRLLSFARALYQDGAPAVLIVPPLPDDTAAQIVQACAAWKIGEPPVLDGRRMLALQRHLRATITEAGGSVETLCDLIMFLPTESKEGR